MTSVHYHVGFRKIILPVLFIPYKIILISAGNLTTELLSAPLKPRKKLKNLRLAPEGDWVSTDGRTVIITVTPSISS